jgi:uncharacterized protein YukE
MSNRNSYDSGASGETQAAIKSLSAQIETLIAQHQANVKAMRGDATMTKVMDEYGAVEAKFNSAATEVQNIIKSLASTLAEFDTHADTAFKAASKAVTDIGNT